MKLQISLLMLGLGLMAGANALEPGHLFKMAPETGMTDLKFVDVTPGSSWTEKDGVLISSGKGESYLITQKTYGDFVLDLDFKPSDDINAGVYMRCQDEQRIKADSCYEANIWDKSKNAQFRTGAIVQRQPVTAIQDTVGKWNHYQLTLQGDTIEVKLNGNVTAILKDKQLSQGFIGFQHKGSGTIEIKDVRLKTH